MMKPDRTPRVTGATVAQVVRFILSGGIVTVVYVATTSLLAEAVGIAFEAALAIGFGVAIALHFALQRLFVWTRSHGFALSLQHQLMRYLLLAAVQYGLTAAATSVLPRPLGVSTEMVYLATAALLSAANFLAFRSGVFHPNHQPTA
jgi:putative flippase GtrA